MKRTKTVTLLLALTLVLAMSQMSFAHDYTADGGTFTFNGSDIVVNNEAALDETISSMVEPGDTIQITLVYKNDDSETTEWYMENQVLDTLEKNASMHGGYSYKLSNVGPDGKTTEIFNSDAVGGTKSPVAGREGLRQATNATEDYFFIQELAPGQSGKTILEVGLDGESQVNSYENSDAKLRISYAVEKKDQGGTVYKHVKKTGVRTGDDTNILLPAAVFLGGLLLLVIALISRRRDRKGGEQK